MVKKAKLEKKNEIKIYDANARYKKAFKDTQIERVIIPDIIKMVQNNIIEINRENETGTRILEKLIVSINSINILDSLKSESEATGNINLKIKILGNILLGETWKQLLNTQTMLDELVKAVDSLMNAICVKEFSKNNRCDLKHFFELVHIRIQVLKALGDAEMKT